MPVLRRSLYFTPTAAGEVHPDDALVEFIDGSRDGIALAFFAINRRKIVDAIIRAHDHVRLLTDRQQTGADPNQLAAIKMMSESGVPVKIDHHTGLMHLKLAIRYGRPNKTLPIQPIALAFGSFNATNGASVVNDEILSIMYDRVFASGAATVFERLWADDKRFGPWVPSATPLLTAPYRLEF